MFNIKINDDLQLNYLHQKYAQDIFNLINENRQYLRQWLVWVDQTQKLDDTKNWIQNSLNNGAYQKVFQTIIFYKQQIVGNVSLNSIDLFNKKTEIGYWLSKKHQGKGIMTKSVNALINYSFNFLDLNRIQIRCAVKNTKSRAVPERLGFKLEGIIRKDSLLNDKFIDHAQYSLLKSEYK